jgi:hypothetical protein
MLLVGQVGDPFTPVSDEAPAATDASKSPQDEAETPSPVLDPHQYLYASYPSQARRLDCMIRGESSWNPTARGAGGRYVGLAQFDYPTWMETPPGRSGASRLDPYASIDAMAWGVVHLGYGRWPVTSRRC